ncbi:MAG: SDR family oxidoreductase [Clostridiales bacterium]|nr:SDR family oxidoreductase [Clostridiales bacterium]
MKNRVAMITGASVGIGRAVALQMAEKGAKLVLLDMNQETLAQLEEELKAYNTEVMAFVCDVSDEQAVNEAVQAATEKFGGIDILVNNAAIWRVRNLFWNNSIETWRKLFDVNVMGVVYCTNAVLPKMMEKGYGRIVNVASVAGVYGNANMSVYSTTKGALIAMSKSLAKEVVEKGIVVNAVSPGMVSPSAELDMEYTKETNKCYAGRTGSDRENADLICFLASEKNGYIVGQNIQIDGCRKEI